MLIDKLRRLYIFNLTAGEMFQGQFYSIGTIFLILMVLFPDIFQLHVCKRLMSVDIRSTVDVMRDLSYCLHFSAVVLG